LGSNIFSPSAVLAGNWVGSASTAQISAMLMRQHVAPLWAAHAGQHAGAYEFL